MGLNTTAGARSQNATMPTQKALLVISQVNQAMASLCTQRPVQEISEAEKKIRASRCDRARAKAPNTAGLRNAAAQRAGAEDGAAGWAAAVLFRSIHCLTNRSRS